MSDDIVEVRLEIEVLNHELLAQTIRQLHAQGRAAEVALTDDAEAAAEVINAGIPFGDAGLELVHWETP